MVDNHGQNELPLYYSIISMEIGHFDTDNQIDTGLGENTMCNVFVVRRLYFPKYFNNSIIHYPIILRRFNLKYLIVRYIGCIFG